MKLDTGQYTGKYITSKNLHGFIISHSQHPALEEVQLHYHRNPYFVYVSSGSYNEYYQRGQIHLTPGDILFHPAGSEHSNVISSLPVSCINLELSAAWFEHLQMPSPNCSFPQQHPMYRKIIGSICNELSYEDAYSESVIYSHAIQLTAASARLQHHPSIQRKYSISVKKYIENADDAQHVSLQDLSSLTGLTTFHLCRIFKKETGISIGEYLRENKIKRACDLLRTTSIPPSTVSMLLGYSDNAHFYREFKKRVGCTPVQYRSSL
jgi:AraC family transcriptional regulator